MSERLEEITLREHLEIVKSLSGSACQDRMNALAARFMVELASLRLLVDERDALYKALFAERQVYYESMFEESEKRVSVALAAKTEEHTDSQWGMGTLISIAVALIALAAVLLKR